MGVCFLQLEVNKIGIRAAIIETGYKQNEIKGDCQILFKDLEASEENSSSFDTAMEMVASKLDLKQCASSVVFVSPQLISFRDVDLPFGSSKKINQVLPFELESLLPGINGTYISDFEIVESEKTSTQILTASIAEMLIEQYFVKLDKLGLKPQMITAGGGYAAAVGFIRKNVDISTFAFLYVDEAEITLILLCNQKPRVIRSLSIVQNSPEDIVCCIKQTIMGFNQRTAAEISFDIIIGFSSECFEPETICNALEENGFSWLKSNTNANDLVLNISPDKLDKYFFNFCKGPYGSSSFIQTYFSNIAASVVLLLCASALFIGSVSSDNSKLNQKIKTIDEKALSIFKETFPDKKRVQDPYLQMKANVREVLKKSGGKEDGDPSVKGKNIKLIEIMVELSRNISPSIDMETSRLLFNTGRLVVSGTTDNFNNVDTIKNKLESSALFNKVTISNAAADKKENKVNFKFIVEL